MTAPLLPPSSGGLSTYRAANWAVQVNTTPGAGSPTWEWWRGISKFDPSQDPTMQDDTDIDSDGFKSQQVTATSLDIAVEGLFKGVRGLDGTVPLNAGCAYVRSLRFEVGVDNELHMRFWRTDSLDTQAYEHRFAVGWKDVGGTNEELQKFTADLRGRGKPVMITKPVDEDEDGEEDLIASSVVALGGTTADGGSLYLVADGTTYEIPFDSDASEVNTIIGSAGTATGTGPWTITWDTDDQPASVTVSDGTLTPAGATCSVENTLAP